MYCEFLRLNEDTELISAADISNNGKYIALSNSVVDGNIKILFVNEGKSKVIKNTNVKNIKILKFFPCSTKLLSVCINNKINIINILDESLLNTAILHNWSNRLDIFSNGNFIVFGTVFNYAGIWDIEKGYINYKLIEHDCIVSSIATFNDQERVVSSSLNKIKIWNYKTVEVIHNLNGHQGVVNIVRVTPDDSKIISSATDYIIKIWNTTTGEQINSYYITDKVIQNLYITSNSKNFIVTYSYLQEYTRIINIENCKNFFTLYNEIDEYDLKNYKMTISNGDMIVTINSKNEIILWKYDRFIPSNRVKELLVKGLNEDIAGIIMKHAVAKRNELAQFNYV